MDLEWLYRSGYLHAFPTTPRKPVGSINLSVCGEATRPFLNLRPDAPECPNCLELLAPTPGQGVLNVALFEQARKSHGE